MHLLYKKAVLILITDLHSRNGQAGLPVPLLTLFLVVTQLTLTLFRHHVDRGVEVLVVVVGHEVFVVLDIDDQFRTELPVGVVVVLGQGEGDRLHAAIEELGELGRLRGAILAHRIRRRNVSTDHIDPHRTFHPA